MRYIPVEISQEMLERATGNLQPHARIPVGVLCDFEDDQEFLRQQLAVHASKPVLFSLLGGTVGNLDGGEAAFFSGFRNIMTNGDAFLLDLPLAGPSWTVDGEPRLHEGGTWQPFGNFWPLARCACSASQRMSKFEK